MVEEDRVREYFSKLSIFKFVCLDGMHQRVLRELADVIVRSFSVIFDQTRQVEKMPKECRKADVTPVF